MSIVTDYALGRQLNHDHDIHTNSLYLLKAGDTATGNILLPATTIQGDNLIAAINVGSTQIQAVRVSIADAGGYFTGTDVEAALQELGATTVALLNDLHYRSHFLTMGA